MTPDGKSIGSGNLSGLSLNGEVVGIFYNKESSPAVRSLVFGNGGAWADPPNIRAAQILSAWTRQGYFTEDANSVAAPIVIVYIFLQRHFIAGMLSGAIKE